MTFDQSNWLDIWNIWEYEIIGATYLAIFVAVIVILFLCTKFKVPQELTLLSLVLFALVISGIKLGATTLIYAYAVTAVGAISYYYFSKAFKTG